jgi:DNA-binding MarR family transcriptional regulator
MYDSSHRNRNQALKLVLDLHQADLQLTRYLDRYVRKVTGISYSQFIMLNAIAQLGHASQAEIATFLGQSTASVNRQVQALEKLQLILQEHSYSHQRTHVVYLTPTASRKLPYVSNLLESALSPLFRSSSNNPLTYCHAAHGFARLARRLRDQV